MSQFLRRLEFKELLEIAPIFVARQMSEYFTVRFEGDLLTGRQRKNAQAQCTQSTMFPDMHLIFLKNLRVCNRPLHLSTVAGCPCASHACSACPCSCPCPPLATLSLCPMRACSVQAGTTCHLPLSMPTYRSALPIILPHVNSGAPTGLPCIPASSLVLPRGGLAA